MRRFFKCVDVSGGTSRFSREEGQVATELEDRLGLFPGSITQEELALSEWSVEGITITKISHEAYDALAEECYWNTVGDYTPSMAH